MKDKTFKWLSKFFITLGILYWLCIILAVVTGCTNATNIERDRWGTLNPREVTISLDDMDRENWHEREEFLRQFD
jgi:hypothetical protein